MICVKNIKRDYNYNTYTIRKMAQKCYAAGSDTDLHCAWCITREIYWNLVKLDQAYCEKHEKSCE